MVSYSDCSFSQTRSDKMKVWTVFMSLCLLYGFLHRVDSERAKRQASACTNPILIEERRENQVEHRISMNCSMFNLEKNVKENNCQFFWIKLEKQVPDRSVEKDGSEESEEEGQRTKIVSDIKYYKTDKGSKVDLHCTLRLRISTLSPGSYKFAFRFYSIDETPDEIIKLSPPEVDISKSCPVGNSVREEYIKERTKATCQCTLKKSGNPRVTHVDWLYRNKSRVDTSLLTKSGIISILEIPFKDRASRDEYFCMAKSSDGFEDIKSYKPKFAYGPRTIILQKLRDLKLCSPAQPITVSCDVYENDYYPNVTVSVEGFHPNTRISKSVSAIRNGYKRNDFFVWSPGGAYNLTCMAKNSVFPDIQTQRIQHIRIEEPPSEPPVLSINENNALSDRSTVKLTLGENITVTCRVHGGFPQVDNTTMEVQGKQEVQTGSTSVRNLTVTMDMDNKKIGCSAKHVTGCYFLKTHATVNVQIGANITFIKMKNVDYQNQKIEVDAGTNLSIRCIGIGKPRPTVIIQDNRGGKLPVQLAGYGSTWVANSHKMASCQDVGKYTCMANNTVAHSIRDFWLLVKCPLQLDDEDVDERRFDFTEGENATIHIKVKGHPGPNENELVKIPTSGKLKGIDSEEQIDTSLYEFVSYQVDEASWELRLFLYQVKVNDSARYRLHVGNGVGEDFKYTFEMTVSKDPRPKSPVSSSYLSTGTIVGLILSSNVVVIILTILSMIAFRKLRERNKYKTKKTSGDGHVTVEFHRPEQEDIGSGNDNVPADASFSGKDAPPLYKNMASKDDFEGEELQSIDTTMYEAMQHAENLDDEREGNENYDIVHADDPSYINLNREPSRQYMTIDDQDPYHVYETPTPAK